MTLRKYLVLLLVCLSIIFDVCELKAQSGKIEYIPTQIDSVLVANTDTVFVFRNSSVRGSHTSPIFYLAKSKDTITLFRYAVPFEGLTIMPQAIKVKLNELNPNMFDEFKSFKFNSFLTPIYQSRENIKKLWSSFMGLNPLALLDDSISGYGCKSVRTNISDSSDINLIMLTKSELKHFYFYAPEFFEKQCPGNLSRQTIIEIDKIFSKYTN